MRDRVTLRALLCFAVVGVYYGCHTSPVVLDGSVQPMDAAVDGGTTDAGAAAGHGGAPDVGGMGGSGGHTAGAGGSFGLPFGDPACSEAACKQGASCVEPSGVTCRCSASTVPACGEIRFRSLGFLPNSDVVTLSAISDDGTTVVGVAGTMVGPSRYLRAFRWTLHDGIVELGFLPNDAGTRFDSEATAVSADGTVVCGYAATFGVHEGFLWRNGDVEYLSPSTEVYDVSADGSLVVGAMQGLPLNAFRWTAATDLVELPPLPGDAFSHASAVSADGRVVVGSSAREIAEPEAMGLVYRPVLWRDDGQAEALPELPNSGGSTPEDINGDGSLIVGIGAITDDSGAGTATALLWSPAGVEALTDPPSAALGISASGSVVVGQHDYEAMLWTRQQGARSLQQLLAASGVDLSGWHLDEARAVSADGKTIVGGGTYGDRSHAFIAWLP